MSASEAGLEGEAIQIDLLRKAPAWKRLRAAAQMSETVMLLSRLGVARRHPSASGTEVRRLVGEAVLGRELACRVYGR